MSFSFNVQYNYRGREVEEQIRRGVRANLTAAAIIWHGAVIQELTGPRSGRMYQIPGTAQKYTASAPGEPPASRTGDLRTSYRFQVQDEYAEIGSPLDYAPMLEYGTRKMAPRPHLMPAFQKARAQIIDALERNVI